MRAEKCSFTAHGTLRRIKGVKYKMAKVKKSKKDAVTLSKNAFIALVLFVVAVTMLGVYAYLGYAGVR